MSRVATSSHKSQSTGDLPPAELTILRVKGREEKFVAGVRSGWKQAREYTATKGNRGFPSLSGYLTLLCSQDTPRELGDSRSFAARQIARGKSVRSASRW